MQTGLNKGSCDNDGDGDGDDGGDEDSDDDGGMVLMVVLSQGSPETQNQ